MVKATPRPVPWCMSVRSGPGAKEKPLTGVLPIRGFVCVRSEKLYTLLTFRIILFTRLEPANNLMGTAFVVVSTAPYMNGSIFSNF